MTTGPLDPAVVLATGATVGVAVLAGAPGALARRHRRAVVHRRIPCIVAPGRHRASGGPPWLASALRDAMLDTDPDRAWRVWLAVMVAGPPVLLVLGGPAVAGTVAIAIAVVPPAALRALRHRRHQAVLVEIAPLVDRIARSMRAGRALPVAFVDAAAAAPRWVRDDVAPVVRALEAGRPFGEGLDAWSRSAAPPDVERARALVVACLALVARTGGAPARALDSVATTLRERRAVMLDARALATQARLSGGVVAGAPLVFGAFVSGVDPTVVRFLVTTPVGLGCLVVGLSLDAVGAWWMARLARRLG